MDRSANTRSEGHIGSLIVSGFFVMVGAVTLYDTTSYTDSDSQVFPQTVGIILIVTAGISFIMRFLKPSDDGGFGRGIWWRRVLLITTMVITCFLMPIVGFLPASIIAFAGGLIAAMHERWTTSNLVLYWGAGAVVMLAFFSLFKFLLYVPLP